MQHLEQKLVVTGSPGTVPVGIVEVLAHQLLKEKRVPKDHDGLVGPDLRPII